MGAQAQPLSEADNFSASITSAARFGTIWFMRDGQAYTQKPGEEKQPLAVPAGEPADVFVAADTVYLVGRETTSVSACLLYTSRCVYETDYGVKTSVCARIFLQKVESDLEKS